MGVFWWKYWRLFIQGCIEEEPHGSETQIPLSPLNIKAGLALISV